MAVTARAKGKKVEKSAVNRFVFGYLVHDVSRTRRTLMDHYMRPLGITRSQWSVMSALSRAEQEGLTQVDLARLLDVGKVSVGGLIDRLETSGHVERRPDPSGDRRVKRVFITDQGYQMLNQMIEVSEDLNAIIMEGIGEDELAGAEAVLMRVKENIKKAIASAPASVPRVLNADDA